MLPSSAANRGIERCSDSEFSKLVLNSMKQKDKAVAHAAAV
jgi:hypothetical protein